MKYQFTKMSANIKTGPLPTTITQKASCPSNCSLRGNGCYAENFPLRLHWDRIDSKGLNIKDLCSLISKIPKKSLWRHNVAGDLAHNDQKICSDTLDAIIAANRNKRGFTYTHHELNDHNRAQITKANAKGFAVNVSCDSIEQLKNAKGLPRVVVLDSNEKRKSFDSAGEKIVTCPATYRDDINCASCGICADINRSYVIGFPAHGTKKKTANLIKIHEVT